MEAGEFAFDAPVWTWSTSVFPSKSASWMLPVKASVRKAEGLAEGDPVTVALEV